MSDQPRARPKPGRPEQSGRRALTGRSDRREKAASGALLGAVVIGSSILLDISDAAEGGLKWPLRILAAGAFACIPFTPPWSVLRRWRHRLAAQWRRWLARLLVFAVFGAAAGGFGAVLVPVAAQWAERALIGVRGCPNATQLTMITTLEDVETAQELAARFEAHTASENFDCPTVRIYVYTQPAHRVSEGLALGWSIDDLQSIGPRPDLWLPGTSRFQIGQVPHTTYEIASTPIVLAVPSSLAADMSSDPARRELTWADLLELARERGWNVVRPDPALSSAAELATVAIYGSVGESADTGRLRDLERALSPAGLPPGNTVDLLCSLGSDQSEARAVITTEQQMVRYNIGGNVGGAKGRTCTTLPGRPADMLYGFYPSDTFALNHRMLRLEWPDAPEGQQRWADEFVAWLGGETGQRALADLALRAGEQPMRPPLTAANGVLPVAVTRADPDPQQVADTASQRAAIRRPTRVLLALDASGSMAERVAAGGPTRLDLAKLGIETSLRRIRSADEIGLWTFQGDAGPTPLVDVGPQPEAVAAALADVNLGGNTPLYRTIAAGVAALPADPDYATALVVLTDGVDTGGGYTSAQLAEAVAGKGVKVFIIATGEATCSAEAIADVTALTAGRCFAAAPATIDVQLATLFEILWGGD